MSNSRICIEITVLLNVLHRDLIQIILKNKGHPGGCAGSGYPDGCAATRYSGSCAATGPATIYSGGCAGVCADMEINPGSSSPLSM